MDSPQHQRTVTAHNDAIDSGNPMHTDAAARAMNYKGALVPGVTVFGYMTHNLISVCGPGWLSHGWMQVQFRRPVYAGETLTITSRNTAPGVIAVETANPDGIAGVVGQGGADVNDAVFTVLPAALPARRALPQPPWPATHEGFAAVTTLGSIEARFAAADAAPFLSAMQDDHKIYREGYIHPAWLLRQANLIVDRNFSIGPWIHVASDVVNHARAPLDAPIEVRAAALELFQRKGHEYADLDVVLLLDGDPAAPVMRIRHRAIYRMSGTPS